LTKKYSPRPIVTVARPSHFFIRPQTLYASNTKIDPKRFSALPANVGSVDAESANYFSNLERKMTDELKTVDPNYAKRQFERHWPTMEEDVHKEFQDSPLSGGPYAADIKPPKDYDPLDLDTHDGMARALSYISSERTFNLNPHPAPTVSGWVTEDLIKVSRHTKVTAAGRVFGFSALVMLGNTEGTGGLGYGRGPTILQAIEMAKLSAEKNALSLRLHRGNSIGKDIKCTYKKSWVRMKCCRTGWGLNAGYDMKMVLRAFGIEDVTVKQGGARNRGARYRAIFLGLRDGVRTKEEVAKILGRKLFNKQKAWYNSGE